MATERIYCISCVRTSVRGYACAPPPPPISSNPVISGIHFRQEHFRPSFSTYRVSNGFLPLRSVLPSVLAVEENARQRFDEGEEVNRIVLDELVRLVILPREIAS